MTPARRNRIIAGKSKGSSEESIKSPAASNSSGPIFSGTKIQVKFDGSCSK